MGLVVDNPEERMIESIITMAKDENTRISACTNVEMNKKIFSIYEMCVEPLRLLDEIQEQMERDNAILAESQGSLLYWTSKFKLFFALAIPIGLWATIAILFFLDLSDNPVLAEHALILKILTCAWFLFWIFLIPMILRIVCKSKEKKFKKFERDVDERNSKRECDAREIIDANSKMLALIPEDYRNYRAVNYMVKAYNSGKVDCIKEAVASCDESKFRENISTNLSWMTMYLTKTAVPPENF